MDVLTWSCVAVLALSNAAVVTIARELGGRQETTQARMESLAGGVSVAYVFVDLLPSLAKVQATDVERHAGRALLADHEVHVLALFGLLSFYGLAVLAQRARPRRADAQASSGLFWVDLSAFALYSAVIGAMLVFSKARDWKSLTWFTLAMVLHFLVNARGLLERHGEAYRHLGRWVLTAAVFVGSASASILGSRPKLYLALAAFIAGAILLNAFKRELPNPDSIRFGAFALGAAGFGLLLLVAAAE
jgi:hypothetical protein